MTSMENGLQVYSIPAPLGRSDSVVSLFKSYKCKAGANFTAIEGREKKKNKQPLGLRFQ